jgi:hypothetical protein
MRASLDAGAKSHPQHSQLGLIPSIALSFRDGLTMKFSGELRLTIAYRPSQGGRRFGDDATDYSYRARCNEG